jgi:hypothetical protein
MLVSGPWYRGGGLKMTGCCDFAEVAYMDLLMIVFTLVFFTIAIAYTAACEKLK